MDIWAVNTFWLSGTVLLYTYIHTYIVGHYSAMKTNECYDVDKPRKHDAKMQESQTKTPHGTEIEQGSSMLFP